MATATEQIFLKITGANDGATDPKYTNYFAVDSVEWALSGTSNLHTAILQKDEDCYTRVAVGDLIVRKKMCKGSPNLLSTYQKKKAWPDATLVVNLSSNKKITYTLTTVSMPSYRSIASGDIPTEEFRLHFSEMKMDYDGSTFDIKAHTSSGS